MCGIFGYVLRDPSRAPSLDAAVAALRHRGPDGDGTFRDDSGTPACGLAHTRLAIIDLSPSGRQPMQTPDGRHAITFNGEIYNYADVGRELRAGGWKPHTSSDTEVILAAYARWGEAAVEKLRGMFALAIWDARERRLFLARDRLGVKPLYVARLPDGLLFASEVRALLGTGRVDRRLDAQALDDYLAFGSVREPRTLVRDVSMLPAGSAAEYRDGELLVRRYWQVPLRIADGASDAQAAGDTRRLLLDSVRLRLVSDVPVAIFLSGGMDSSALVALASKVATSPVHTFTVTFDEAAYDESRFAREIASRFGVEHHVVHLPGRVALEHVDDALAALDQPSADGTNTYFVAKAAHEAGLKVALSGIGGDEIFAGYGSFRRFAAITRFSRALRRLPSRPFQRVAARGALPMRLRKAAALLSNRGHAFGAYAVLRGMFLAPARRELLKNAGGCGPDPATDDQRVEDWIRDGGDPIEAYGALELTNYLRNTLLRDADVMGMAHALEIREPLLDDRLIESALTLPGRMKLSRGMNKPLLARAVPELPASTSTRPKMGFTLPLEAWLRGPLRGWAEERLLEGPPVDLVDRNAVRDLWQSFLAGKRGVSFSRVWTLVALSHWCRAQRMTA